MSLIQPGFYLQSYALPSPQPFSPSQEEPHLDVINNCIDGCENIALLVCWSSFHSLRGSSQTATSVASHQAHFWLQMHLNMWEKVNFWKRLELIGNKIPQHYSLQRTLKFLLQWYWRGEKSMLLHWSGYRVLLAKNLTIQTDTIRKRQYYYICIVHRKLRCKRKRRLAHSGRNPCLQSTSPGIQPQKIASHRMISNRALYWPVVSKTAADALW